MSLLSINRYKILLFFIYLFFGLISSAQTVVYSAKNLHSHNDYKQSFPFWDAFNQGFGSIEVDIFLYQGQLLVAHEENELDTSKTLKELYLDPLQKAIQAKKNVDLLLLVDIKTEALVTLDVLIEQLRNYPDLIAEKKLQITITGNQPDHEKFANYPSWIWFDGNPETLYQKKALSRIALMSANLKKYTSWNGKGILTGTDKNLIVSVIQKSNFISSKKFRFWNAPDIPNAWYQLMKLGVGYINTDHLSEAALFMKHLHVNSFTSRGKQSTYQPNYKSDGIDKAPKNIILLIADGMGMSQLYAAYTANRGDLTTFKIRHTGSVLTSSGDSYITDSAPSATAYSSGKKSNNRSVGVSNTGQPLKLLPDHFAELGMMSAVVTAGDITDATPAAFYAHQVERTSVIPILEDLKNASLSVLMGAGSSIIDSFLYASQEYWEITHQINRVTTDRLTKKYILTDSSAGKPAAKGRNNWLTQAFLKSIDLVSKNENGFFIMAEAAQVDYGGHANQLPYVVSEVLDFDKLVSAAIAYADKDGETLVIITADHETGGLTLLDGDIVQGYVSGHFSTNDHTAIPVPFFAYGPKSHIFKGILENTDIFKKIIEIRKGQ